MRRPLTALLAALVALTGVALVSSPAQAATGVTIKTIKAPTAAYQGTATVKPSVSTSGPVKITSKTLTVKSGSKTVASKKTSAKLKAGSYKVTTHVAYKVKKNGKFGATKKKSRTQSLTVKKGAKNCATRADYDKIVTVEMYETDESGSISEKDVDSVKSSAKKLTSPGKSLVKITLGEMYDFAVKNNDQEGADAIQQFIDIYTRKGIFEIRDYAMCQSRKLVELTHIGGDTWFKEIV